MCRDAACQGGMGCPHVVYQYARSALISGEHLVVGRHEQFHTGCSSQIGGLAFIQIAHDVELLTEITAAIDRQQCNVHCEPAQALNQAVEANCIASSIHPHSGHLNDIAKITVESLVMILDELKPVDRTRRLEATHAPDSKESDTPPVALLIALAPPS